MPYEDHVAQAKIAVTCAVLTISDTRTKADDKSGQIIKEILEEGGHQVGPVSYTHLRAHETLR